MCALLARVIWLGAIARGELRKFRAVVMFGVTVRQVQWFAFVVS
jgi:hypothetical protein